MQWSSIDLHFRRHLVQIFSAYCSSRRNIIVFLFSPFRQMSGKYSIKLRALPFKCTVIPYWAVSVHSVDIVVNNIENLCFSMFLSFYKLNFCRCSYRYSQNSAVIWTSLFCLLKALHILKLIFTFPPDTLTHQKQSEDQYHFQFWHNGPAKWGRGGLWWCLERIYFEGWIPYSRSSTS